MANKTSKQIEDTRYKFNEIYTDIGDVLSSIFPGLLEEETDGNRHNRTTK